MIKGEPHQKPPLPVTAKLSRRFYDQLGDDVANELVNWFNAVDETYRNQLRELNDLNWERFRSELRAEGAAIRAEMDKRFAEMDKRFDVRFAGIDARFSAIDTHFARIEEKFPTFEQRIDAKFAKCEAKMLKWMFMFWAATIVPLATLSLALNGAFQR